MFSLAMSLDFDLIFWLFFTFWASSGLILGSGYSSNAVPRSTYVVKQLSFSMIPSILTFDFDLIFGHFFGGSRTGLFLGRGRVQKVFWGSLM